MLPEHQLAPYHATDLTGRRVLVIAPHPDDETFGCGGALKLHRMAGDPVRVLFVTNGAKGDSRELVDKSHYVALREEEAAAACRDLDVEDFVFWRYEDRAVHRHPEITQRLTEAIADYQPDLIYTPSPYEIHPDHRAATHWLLAGLESPGPGIDIGFYEVSQAGLINRLVDISQVLAAKIQAMDRYASQLAERPYKQVTLALNQFRTLTLSAQTKSAEGFLLLPSQMLQNRSFHRIYFDRLQRFHPFEPTLEPPEEKNETDAPPRSWLAKIGLLFHWPKRH